MSYSPKSILDLHIKIRMSVNQTNAIMLVLAVSGLLYPLQLFDRGLDRLQATIERTRVYPEWLRVELRAGDMCCELMGLAHTMRSQRWVCWIPRRCGELGPIGSRAEIDGPVEPVLQLSGLLALKQRNSSTYPMASEINRV
jgi:hypothetical protein